MSGVPSNFTERAGEVQRDGVRAFYLLLPIALAQDTACWPINLDMTRTFEDR